MTRERIVIDTNVFISGLLSATSVPARAIDHASAHGQLLASVATLEELMAKLMSPKFDPYVGREPRDTLLLRLAPLVEMIDIAQTVRVSRDPNDDKFLDVAINGRAAVVVTGDRDLLALHPFRGIAIVTPKEFLARK